MHYLSTADMVRDAERSELDCDASVDRLVKRHTAELAAFAGRVVGILSMKVLLRAIAIHGSKPIALSDEVAKLAEQEAIDLFNGLFHRCESEWSDVLNRCVDLLPSTDELAEHDNTLSIGEEEFRSLLATITASEKK